MPDDEPTRDDKAPKTARRSASAPVPAPAPTPAADEQKYPVSRLLADTSILGQSTPVLAAAFADADVNPNDKLSRDDVDRLIADSQARIVQTPEEA